MTTTRAAVLSGHDKPYELADIELDGLRPDEVLVRIAGVGFCHTDLLARDEGFAARLAPVVLGHEGSGVVEQVGSAVRRVRAGDHVVLSFDSCGWCPACMSGSPAYCAEFDLRNVSGRRADGTPGARDADGGVVSGRWFGQSSFADHAVATERNTVVVDRGLPIELLGPLGCGIQTGAGVVLNEMRLAPGRSVAVFGAGAVGLAAVMAARIANAREIVVVDLVPSRLELAAELGATRVVRGDTGDAAELRSRVVQDGPGLDFTLDTTANTVAISAAVTSLARQGSCVLVGVGSGRLDLPPTELAGRSVTYSLEGNAVPQRFIPRLLDFWRRGQFPFDRLIRTYPLADIGTAEAHSLAGETVKPVLLTANAQGG
jgi:aryl-alcohol dehydrogenase